MFPSFLSSSCGQLSTLITSSVSCRFETALLTVTSCSVALAAMEVMDDDDLGCF